MTARTIRFEMALASALFMASADARATGRFPAAGMIAFGAYSVADARYRRV